MENQILSEEFLRMQKLAGILTESEYNELISLNELSFSDIVSGVKTFFSKFKFQLTPEVEALILKTATEKAKVMTQDQVDAFNTNFPSKETIINKIKTLTSQDAEEPIAEGVITNKINSLLSKLIPADSLLVAIFSTLSTLILSVFKMSPNIAISIGSIVYVISLFLIALHRELKERKK